MEDKYWSVNMGKYRANAHRLVWEWEKGPIPDGYQVHHICHNRQCVNTDHMVLLTIQEHGRLHTKESSKSKGKFNNKSSIRVAQIHPEHGLLKIWDSMHEAGRAGFPESNVCYACNGRYDLYYDCWWMRIK